MNKELVIITTENGFIVSENSEPMTLGRQWVFQNPSDLGNWVEEWGRMRELKVNIKSVAPSFMLKDGDE